MTLYSIDTVPIPATYASQEAPDRLLLAGPIEDTPAPTTTLSAPSEHCLSPLEIMRDRFWFLAIPLFWLLGATFTGLAIGQAIHLFR